MPIDALSKLLIVAATLLTSCYRSHGPEAVVIVPDAAVTAPAARIVQVSAGFGAGCVRLEDGRVACWGGALHCAPLTESETESAIAARAVLVPGIDDAVDVAGVGQSFCARRRSGETVCWGRWAEECWTEAHAVHELDGAVQLSASAINYLLCARMGDGTVRCHTYLQPSIVVDGLEEASMVDAGGFGACALVDGGMLRCWDWTGVAHPVDGVADRAFDMVAVDGSQSGCGVSGGLVTCWGAATQALGGGHPTPMLVPEMRGVVQLDVDSFESACAVLDTGLVRCWGENAHGELGDGTTRGAPVPTVVQGIDDAVSVSTADSYACAVSASGRAYCWGTGWLGNGEAPYRSEPIVVAGLGAGLESFPSVWVDEDQSCARGVVGSLWCWGRLQDGHGISGTPVPIEVASGVVQSCGDHCWVLADHSLHCALGWDAPGLDSIDDVQSLVCGNDHACVLSSSGAVSCWGANDFGQLGDGQAPGSGLRRLTVVTGLRDIVELTAGGFHTCARDSSGGVACWGDDSAGQLGDGGADPRSEPVVVLEGAQRVVAGGLTTCALAGDGSTRCWGAMDAVCGPACDTYVRSPMPLPVPAWTELSLAENRACLITPDSTVRCTRQHAFSITGFASYRVDGAWTPMARLAAVATIGVSSQHVCAHVNGRVLCWGFNANGELGRSDAGFHSTPVEVALEL